MNDLIKILIFLLIINIESFSEEWPKIITHSSGTEVTFYQPQIESFDNIILQSRAAIMIKSQKQTEPIFGAVWIQAKVLTDRDTRLITLDEVVVTDAKFPNQDSTKIEELKKFLSEEIPKWELDITIDQLIASLEDDKSNTKENFKTDPPEIIHVTTPSVLITIDGEAKLKKLEDTDFEMVINTPFFIVKDNWDEVYYLKGGVLWYKSENIYDEYEFTEEIPDELIEFILKKNPDEYKDIDPDTIKVKPEIIVRTKPAELIVTTGEPKLASIEGTSLLFVENTDSDIIFDIKSQSYFILISGRWFQSKSLEGPWSFIEPENLPADFVKIPGDSDMSNVLANVPGTQESKDAILDTQIPQTAKVERSTKLEVNYDGEPKFEALSTTDLYYATNTDKNVIKYYDKYYCCDNAIWFIADSPKGPWKVTDRVPDKIYEMTPDSPVYNTKYVYVYDSTPEYVYTGYYPGYTGCYVYGGTVIYGTGYYYQPWYGTYYYPRPVTYGFSVHYNPYMGWSFGFGMSYGGPYGWMSFSYHSYPYYGGYWGAGRYHSGYHHGYYQGRRNGFYAGYHYAQNNPRINPYGDGNRNVYNRENRGNINTNDRQRNNVSTMDRQRNNVSTGDVQRNRVNTNNNVYADKQGNVYKKENNQWQSREGNNWSGVDQSKNKSNYEGNKQDLNRQQTSRDRGNQRTQTYNQQRTNTSRSMNRGGGRRR
ncbi:MAG: DUF4766 domain-containing protein [Ignavibacteriaceae bacterium]|nr:DUF4766 domain-containing protein [Ignavibacteriaceae bacterium]